MDDYNQIRALQNAVIIKDATTLSSSEADVIKLSKELHLFNRETLKEINEAGRKGELPIEIDAKIKVLQIRLRDDGKYDGPIDGILGIKSIKGLEKLLYENDLFPDVKKLSEEFDKAIYERIPVGNPSNLSHRVPKPGNGGPEL